MGAMSACGLARCQPREQWSSTERRFKVELLHWKFMDRLLGVSLQTLILWSQSLSNCSCIIVNMTWPSCWIMYVLIIMHDNQWNKVTSPSEAIIVHYVYSFKSRRSQLEYCSWFGQYSSRCHNRDDQVLCWSSICMQCAPRNRIP